MFMYEDVCAPQVFVIMCEEKMCFIACNSLSYIILSLSDEVWYHGYHISCTRQRGTGGFTMSRPTQP
jgi:hypothetical protein